jgi:hypothetical protein
MIRRLAQSIRQQHWTPFAIELVIVVLGVFIAFQVTDWSNQRTSHGAERRHLEEIAEDLRADVVVFDQINMTAARRISAIDYLLGETPGVNRPMSITAPSGARFEIPAGPPPAAADQRFLLASANLLRSSTGNRTGFEALIGAGGMQTIRDRRISRKLQVYYAALEDQNSLTSILTQMRSEGIVLGYPLGLSAFGEMDPGKVIAIVRGSPGYSAYLRTSREFSAIFIRSVGAQRKLAVELANDIDRYLGEAAG